MLEMSSVLFGRRVAVRSLVAAWLCFAAVPHAGAASADPAAGPATNRPPVNVLLLGYYIWAKPDYVERCKKENINIYGPMRDDPTGADPAHYPVEFLKQFHVVVASGPLERPWDPQVVRNAIKPGIVANLLEFNRQGGGVVWTPLGAGRGANAWTESIGKRIDAVALDEALLDPAKDVSVSIMSSFRDRLRYIWTTDIVRHPVTEGVRGLFFGRTGEWGWPGTIPMRFGEPWTVLVRGMESTRTTLNGHSADSGTREFGYTDKVGTYSSSPQVMAVRNAPGDGKGRMLVQPIYTTWTWGNYGHPAMKDAFLFNGDGIYPSDGQRLLVNAWRWLAEPAQTAGGFGGYEPPAKAEAEKPVDLSPVVWKDADWSRIKAGPEVRGIFGAQSKWGGGSGTVAEWAEAARTAGLDFIVFTDDPGLHTPETYASLVAECMRNSSTNFAIVPGVGCEDVNGVFRFFPDAPTLPHRKHFDAQGRIIEPVGIAVDYAWTIGQVAAGVGKMPYNPWWEHVIMACAPLTYENNQLTDDGVMRWLRSCEANQTTLLPLSLVRLKSPGLVSAAARTAHMSVLRTADLGAIRQFARTGAGGQVMPSYLTSGPRVPVWTKEDGAGEPFRPNSSRFRVLLKATSEAGLAEVRIIDAADGSDYRLWKPAGQTEFTATIDEQASKQRVLGLIVTDVNGRTAIAPPVYTYQGGNRSWHMGDRLMGMHHTTSWDQERKHLMTHGSPACISYHKGSPDGGGEFVTDHIAGLKFQGLEGSGIYPPAFKLNPLLETDLGREPAAEAMRFEQRLAGHDLAVFDYVGDQEYAEGQRFDFSGTPRIAHDTRLATTVSRNWLIRTRYMAPVVMEVNEISVTFKQDVQLKRLFLGRYHGPDAPGEFNFLVIKPGTNRTAVAWNFEAGEKFSRHTDFAPGGYLYQAKALAGTMGFVALDDKVGCDSQARGHEFVLQNKYLKQYRAGETLSVRMLRVSRAFEAQQGSNEWLERFLTDYGVACAPAYAYKVVQGALREINYVLDLEQKDGGAALELGKYDLPEPLPVRVSGVRKNAALGEYDLDTKRVRPLPFFEGTVTTSVETQLRATRLYVGEWLSWDSDAVRVSLVTDGTDFLLEAHNPTGTEIVCTFAGAPGFLPLKNLRKELRLAPYSSVKEKLQSAPGTVKQEPMR